MSTMTSRNHPPVSAAGKVAAVLLLLVAGFQVTLAAGAPFGEAAMGGSNPGVLPTLLRVSSGVAALAYLLLAGVAGTRWAGATLRRRLLYATSALMAIGAMMNVASPSFLERIIWAPVTVALLVALWRAAGHSSLAHERAAAA